MSSYKTKFVHFPYVPAAAKLGSNLTPLKIRESNTRALFLGNCTPNNLPPGNFILLVMFNDVLNFQKFRTLYI